VVTAHGVVVGTTAGEVTGAVCTGVPVVNRWKGGRPQEMKAADPLAWDILSYVRSVRAGHPWV